MGDLEAEPAELLAPGARLRAPRSRPSVPPAGPSITVCRSTGGRGICGRRGDQPGLELPGPAPSRTTRLRSMPSLVAPVVGGEPFAAAPRRGSRCGSRCCARRRAGNPPRRRSRPSGRGRESRARARRLARRSCTRACCGSASARRQARSARARSRRGRRSAAARPRSAAASRRAGARRPGPARARRGRARRRGRSGPGRARRSAAGSRRRASAKFRFAFVTPARTRSPGRAPATKTTKPSLRATPRPPYASDSISSSSDSPRRGFLAGARSWLLGCRLGRRLSRHAGHPRSKAVRIGFLPQIPGFQTRRKRWRQANQEAAAGA